VRYKTRQIYVEAFQLGHDEPPDWFKRAIEFEWAVLFPNSTVLRTSYGSTRTVFKGDWIICGYNGIPHAIAKNDFDKMYYREDE
jgi:hypothetical protein